MNSIKTTNIIGYTGAITMMLGLSYWVLSEAELSWSVIEVIGYLAVSGLLFLPATRLSDKMSPNILKLTSFLGVLLLPLLIVVTMTLHQNGNKNILLAGTMICMITSIASIKLAWNLDSLVIGFYGIVHLHFGLNFITRLILQNIAEY